MINQFKEISDFVKLEIPESVKLPIAIIGAGGIVDGAHLPAYKKAGLDIVGITDVDQERAKDVANRHGISKVYPDLATLLRESDAQVIDIAVPPAAQKDIFIEVAKSGRHILAQKPLATNVADGEQMIKVAKAAGVIAVVNQQLRFEEGIAAAYKMVDMGWIGEVTSISITVNLATPWEMFPWAKNMDKLEIMVHSIHYHDVIRWFLGEPISVYCVAGRTKGQFPIGETRTVSTYKYPGEVTAIIHANHVNRGGDNYAEIRIDGDCGAIRGTLGLLYDYPTGRLDTLEINSTKLPTDGWTPYEVTTRWFPDAFIGTMGSLLGAIAGKNQPRSTVEENLGTLKLIAALYESIEKNQVVEL
jgi:predicted dehydrogenase